MRIIETQRLYLREFTIDDAEDIYLLNTDIDVMKFTGDKPFASIEQAKHFLESYDHYHKYGLGRWAVVHHRDDRFLGWCGLKYTTALDEYDIGFRFFRSEWNRGYATESALASIHHGFVKLRLPCIVGRAMRENISSIRVLEKIGLSYVRPFDFDGQEGVIYHIENKCVQ